MGLDATNKWPGETQREWGRPIKKDPDVVAHIDAIWDELAILITVKRLMRVCFALFIDPTEKAHDNLKLCAPR